MRCAECRLLISKYVDGEADAHEIAHMQEHVAGCANCLRVLSEFRLVNSRFAGLEWREPDPTARSRFEARLDRLQEAASDEIPITRRQEPSAPLFTPQRRLNNLFGGLATGFALLLVFATGLTIWQLNGTRTGLGGDAATTLPSGNATIVATIAVAANAELPTAQSTQLATLDATEPERGPGVASPTAPSYPKAEPVGLVHSVRDERFGYEIAYPANWWTSRVKATSSDVIAQRIVKPWTLANTRYGADLKVGISILVRDNKERLTLQQAAARYLSGLEVSKTQLGALEVLRATRSAENRLADEAVLLHAGLIYQFELIVASTSATDADALDTAWPASQDAFDQVLLSFKPGADITAADPGAAPLLFLQNNNLWSIAADSNSSAPLAGAIGVRDFAVSPDLAQVAMVTNSGPQAQGQWGGLISRLFIGANASVNSWTQAEVHDVYWYDNEHLVVIGGGNETPFGLYMLDLTTNNSTLLAQLEGNMTDARNLQVSPDRLWLTFVAGQEPDAVIYRVAKDGGRPVALTSPLDDASGVRDYSWLQPDADATSQRIVLLTASQFGELTVWPGGATSLKRQPLVDHNGGADLAISPEGPAAYLALKSGKPEIELIEDTWRDSLALPIGASYHATDSSQPVALSWMPNSRYLAVQETGTSGEAVFKLIDRLQHVTDLITIER